MKTSKTSRLQDIDRPAFFYLLLSNRNNYEYTELQCLCRRSSDEVDTRVLEMP